jgi:predicted nucleotidyltransferase
MTSLHELALSVGVDERTLRRAVSRGLIRAHRPGPRRLDLSFAERHYVETHWSLLARLVGALRTWHDVRLAVVYGSTARGASHGRSDIDLLASFHGDGDALAAASLAGALSEELGRDVQVTPLAAAREAPLLLRDVLRDGRVLVDRDDEWTELKRRARDIDRAAAAAEIDLDRRVAELAELVRE